MSINKNQKVVCVCRSGQVRSVAARHILAARFGFNKVIACGWENNDQDTLDMLYKWADVILVVGRGLDWKLSTPPEKTHLVDIGQDVYGRYNHPELIGMLVPKIEALL